MLRCQLEAQRNDQVSQAEYTHAFLNCLIQRHDLVNMMATDQSINGVPSELLDQLKQASLPSQSALALLSIQEQNHLLRELIWICGHGAIRWYREQGLSNQGRQWQPRMQLSRLHWSESYLQAALALLTSTDPSADLLRFVTSGGCCEAEQIQHNLALFLELQAAILCRHKEDEHYAALNTPLR